MLSVTVRHSRFQARAVVNLSVRAAQSVGGRPVIPYVATYCQVSVAIAGVIDLPHPLLPIA